MSIPTIPKVFVIPPEEDHDPPFCCFDAAQPLHSDYFDHDPLESVLEPSLVVHRDSLVQRSIADILTSEDESHDDPVRTNFAGDNSVDSEVIEVVKFSRHAKNGPLPPPPPTSASEPTMNRTKTLRSRASRAFHSIKNAARSSRSKKHQSDSDVDCPEPSSRAPSPSPSRRSSVVFSQLFAAPTPLKSRRSSESFNDDTPSPVSFSTPSIPAMIQPISSAEMQSFTPYPDSDYDDDDDDDEQGPQDLPTPRAVRHSSSLRSPSPVPSIASSKLGRSRFSVLNIFSSSSSTSVKLSDSASPPTPPAMTTRDPLAPSTDSSETSLSGSSGSSIPITPVDEASPPLSLPKPSKVQRLRAFSFSRKKEPVSSKVPPPRVRVADEPENDPDMTIGEIRLDSLHFDDLSFDVDRFRS